MSDPLEFLSFLNPVFSTESIATNVPYGRRTVTVPKKGDTPPHSHPTSLSHMWLLRSPESKDVLKEYRERRIAPLADVTNFWLAALPIRLVNKELFKLYLPTLVDGKIELGEPVEWDEPAKGEYIETPNSKRKQWKSDLYLMLLANDVEKNPYRQDRINLVGWMKGIKPAPFKWGVEFVIPPYIAMRTIASHNERTTRRHQKV